MDKRVSKKRTSAIFLAIVLVAGTIALSDPTFMINAQAISDREKDYDNDYNKKSYDKYRDDKSREQDKDYGYDNSYGKEDDRDKFKDSNNVNIKKIKCNNINVNLNEVDADIGLPFNDGLLNGVIAEAQAAEDEGTNSFGSGSKSNDENRHSDSNIDYGFVFINNNNNIVVENEPEPPTCKACFTTILTEEEFDDLIEAIKRLWTNLITRTL